MNKKMKALALLLVGIMSASTLTACGGDTAPAGDAQTSAGDKTEAAAPATGEPVNLVWWTIGGEPKELAAVTEKLNEYTKEKLNVTVEMK